jgi:hypothetical protein
MHSIIREFSTGVKISAKLVSSAYEAPRNHHEMASDDAMKQMERGR